MKNQQICHQALFRVYRVHGIQNDRLDLTISEFLTVWKTQYRSRRYQQFCEVNKHEKL